MTGDFLSMRMLDEKIKEARKEDGKLFKNAKEFDKQLQKDFKEDQRKQKINLNGKWFEK